MTSITITGGGHTGCALARRLDEDGETVSFVDADPHAVASAEDAGLTAFDGDPTHVLTLREADINPGTTVVVAGESDSANLLVSQLVQVKFGVRDIVVLVNDPRNRVAFAETGVETVSAADVLSDALADVVRSRRQTDWLAIDAADRNTRQEVK